MKAGMFRSVFTFGSLTLVSRVLGLVRDMVVAGVFGSGPQTDAFIVAFKIPNFMRRLFAEGAFSQSFVPVLSEYRTKHPDQVGHLAANTLGVLGAVLLVLTALGVAGAPWVVNLFAPGFSNEPEKYGLAVEMLRWTFPYILFISLTAAAAGILNTWGRFGPPAFAPVLLNLCMIGAAIGIAPLLETPILALAAAVLVAGVLQLLLQLPFLARIGMLRWPRFGWRDPGVRKIMRLMAPAAFGSSVAQINLLLDTVLASFLITGSVTWLYFSDRLVEFPLGVFGVALGTVLLPRLSSEHAAASPERFSRTMDWGLRWVLVLIAPATVGLSAMALPIIATLFHYGQFGELDVMAAGLSLAGYSLGLFGFVLVKVLAPGHFARQDMRTPVRCAVISLLCNMVLSVTVVLWLHDTGVGHVGLAMATAVAAWVNATLLYRALRRTGHYTPCPGWRRLGRQVGLATLVMALLLLWPASQAEHWLQTGVWERVLHLSGWLAVAALVYFGALRLFGWDWRGMKEPPSGGRAG